MKNNTPSNAEKGFTLVELAIVLVVIGLLMGMAFKGKSLVDAARIKSEINRINKISTALNVYYSKYGVLPGSYGTGSDLGVRNMYDDLIKEGILKESDFGKGGTAAQSGNYVFSGCRHTIKADGKQVWSIVNLSQQENVCIMQGAAHIKNVALNKSDHLKASNWTNAYKVCQTETLLDDKNLYAGEGRIVDKGVGSSPLLSDTAFDCTKYAKEQDIGNDKTKAVSYMYRVF